MLAVFIVALVEFCLLTSARTVPEFIGASNVLKSSAREAFETEHHYMAKLRDYQALVSDKTLNNHLVSHPTVVRLDDSCGDACHQNLLSTFGEHRVTPLDSSSAMVSASVAELEAFTAANGADVKFHFAVLPEMKIDTGVSALAKHAKCDLSSVSINTHQASAKSFPTIKKSKASVSLRLLLAPLSDSERTEFIAYTHKSSKAADVGFYYHYPEKQEQGEKHYVEVTLGACAHVDAVSKLFANRREVMWVERIMPAYTHNRWARGVCDTGSPASYPLETNPLANFTGRGEIVGLSDTGIDMKHCFFRDPDHETPYIQSTAASASTPNFAHRKVVQYYLLTKGNEKSDGLDDTTGHGTHTAGTIAGRAVQRYGDYQTYEGMASDAKIAFFDIGDKDSSNPGESLIIPTDLNTGMLNIMYSAGVRVFSNSWGTTGNNYDSMAVQVDTFMWNHPDALVLFSAGNSGENGLSNTVNSPSTNKNGVSVGASLNDHESWLAYETETEDFYGIEAVAGFSSQGPTQDNRLKPTVLAPGFWTTSSYGTYNSTQDYCSVRVLRGTSMACPTAAGYALKVRQYFLDGYYPSGVRTPADGFTPSGALIKAVLVHSGQKMKYKVASDAGSNGVHAVTDISASYPSTKIGYGRIQMSSVLNFAPSTTNPLNFFVIGGATSGDANYAQFATAGTNTYTFTTSAGTQHSMRVTLSYTDYPGTAITNGNAMVNRLTVSISGGGSTFAPYLVSGTVTDNTQVIDIANPVASTTYTVTVTATSITRSPQPYALIVSGATTYIPDGPTQDLSYSIPEDNFTASGGALKYILALGFLTLLLAALVYFIRRVSNKKTSMMLDPDSFEATDNYYEDGVQDGRMGGKKSIFAKIRDIRSGKNKRPVRDVEMEGYYED